MKRKHFVLGLVFNYSQNAVLLIEKKRPEWQAGHWNGIGGKIKEDDPNPMAAMEREAKEETGYHYNFIHFLTFVCPGGTVYAYKALAGYQRQDNNYSIPYKQIEDEKLKQHRLDDLPDKLMTNLRWIIPLALADIPIPIMIHQNSLGV